MNQPTQNIVSSYFYEQSSEYELSKLRIEKVKKTFECWRALLQYTLLFNIVLKFSFKNTLYFAAWFAQNV